MENECQPQKDEPGNLVTGVTSGVVAPDPICTDGVERLRLRIYGNSALLPTLIYLPGVQGDWTMIGAFREAFGSQVLWELVKRTPQRWRGLILAGGFVKYPTSALLSAARYLCPRISHRRLHQCLPAYILYAHLRHSNSPTSLAGAHDFVARRTIADQWAMNHRLRLIAENDPRSVASGCRIPLHHLYGALDPIVPWSGVVKWLAQHCPGLRASRRFWLSDHTVLATAAEASAAQIRQWMA